MGRDGLSEQGGQGADGEGRLWVNMETEKSSFEAEMSELKRKPRYVEEDRNQLKIGVEKVRTGTQSLVRPDWVEQYRSVCPI